MRLSVLLLLLACLMLAGCQKSMGSQSMGSESFDLKSKSNDADPIDYSCQTSADCAVKNIGNCCGYYPACVNRDSPTFPEQVKAQCAAEGRLSVCGFQEISACTCVENRCAAVPGESSETLPVQ